MTTTTNNIVRQCRTHAGLTQVELAGRLGVKQQTIAQREGERYRLSVPWIMAVADACDVAIYYDGKWRLVLPPEASNSVTLV